MREPAFPSGGQHLLELGGQRAWVVEVGAALRSYSVGSWEVLDGFGAQEYPRHFRGHLLLPWPNRVGGGRYRFAEQDHQLSLSEPERGNAIHGLVNWDRWEVVRAEPTAVRLGLDLHPRPGYPFSLHLQAGYALSDEGLTVVVEATNVGSTAAPFGAGAHPYFQLGTGGPLDDTLLGIPAASRLEVDEHMIPRGRASVEGTGFDFRQPRPLGKMVLDTAYGDLQRDTDGRARVTMADPAGRRSLSVWGDRRCRWFMVFSGDTLPGPERRRSMAIEPMTCPPAAFDSGEDLEVIPPGDTFSVTWGVAPSPLS